MSDVVLFVILVVIALMNVAATVAVRRDEYAEPRQKTLQVIIIWVIPILGALVVLAVHREPEKPSGTYRRAGDGLGDDFGSQRPFAKSIGDVVDGD